MRACTERAGTDPDDLPTGAILGVARLHDRVEGPSDDRYRYRRLLANVRRFPTPVPYQGAADVFKVHRAEVREPLGHTAPVAAGISWSGRYESYRSAARPGDPHAKGSAARQVARAASIST